MKMLIVIGLSLALGACQTTYESMNSAERVCSSAGIKRGTRSFDNCANAAYQESRRQSEQASAQLAMGVAAGVIGGVILGASSNNNSNNYYYGPRPYYGGVYRQQHYYRHQPRVIYGPRHGWGHHGRRW